MLKIESNFNLYIFSLLKELSCMMHTGLTVYNLQYERPKSVESCMISVRFLKKIVSDKLTYFF